MFESVVIAQSLDPLAERLREALSEADGQVFDRASRLLFLIRSIERSSRGTTAGVFVDPKETDDVKEARKLIEEQPLLGLALFHELSPPYSYRFRPEVLALALRGDSHPDVHERRRSLLSKFLDQPHPLGFWTSDNTRIDGGNALLFACCFSNDQKTARLVLRLADQPGPNGAAACFVMGTLRSDEVVDYLQRVWMDNGRDGDTRREAAQAIGRLDELFLSPTNAKHQEPPPAPRVSEAFNRAMCEAKAKAQIIADSKHPLQISQGGQSVMSGIIARVQRAIWGESPEEATLKELARLICQKR